MNAPLNNEMANSGLPFIMKIQLFVLVIMAASVAPMDAVSGTPLYVTLMMTVVMDLMKGIVVSYGD